MRYLRTIIVILILVFFLQGCSNSGSNQNTNVLSHLLDDYSKAIANGIPDDMSLTIYYMTPYVSTDMPIDETQLIIWGSKSEDKSFADKVVIDSTQLSSKIDQLKNINSSSLQKPSRSLPKDLRIYYYIETETAGKVLEVGLNGIGGTMFVNGEEAKYDPVFFDLVSPYLDSWK